MGYSGYPIRHTLCGVFRPEQIRHALCGESAYDQEAPGIPKRIADVRGLGLLLGVELTFPGQEVWTVLFERGFVLNLTQERVLRLVPPLTIDRTDLDAFAAAPLCQ